MSATPVPNKEKLKLFEAAVRKVKKKLPDSVWYKDTAKKTDVIPTNLPSVDLAMRTGGLPTKRIIELYGPEASGKTTLCMHIVSQVQARGGLVAYLDAENSLDPPWAEKLGVDLDSIAFLQQEDAESALDGVREIVRSGACDLVVVDSVAALVTKAELEGNMDDKHVAVQARLMSQAMKILSVELLKTPTICIFTNQLRDKIGGSWGGPSEDTPGGRALKFHASIRIDVRKSSDDDAFKRKQHHAKVRIAKNKVAPPFGIGYFRIDPEIGIIRAHSIVAPALELKIIEHEDNSKSYGYKGKTYRGLASLTAAVEQSPDLQNELSTEIYTAFEKQLDTAPEEYKYEPTEPETDPAEEDDE